MTEQPGSESQGNDPIERLENALVRMAFILEQREARLVRQQKKQEASFAVITGQIEALEARIEALLQPVPFDGREG
ncbi:hypothetical protein PT277_07465 [Acetobacteraceae bacterium ESL0709]|nr:hypothetical protein [Acetobacteraceae bacterium ESL0697]MDF7678515.1 hypothetical protein [Acetobacteraceae bacterium ESL0709]